MPLKQITNPRVAVLLSTYNGQRFLDEQLHSILGQSGVDVSLYCRDDGSTDRTLEKLRAMAAADARIHVIPGTHKGATASFLDLFSLIADEAFDLIALADQDDIWDIRKLQRQYACLSGIAADIPALCYCSFFAINENGAVLGDPRVASPVPRLEQILLRNDTPGCTIALNTAAARLIAATVPPAHNIFMHDWWILSFLTCVGRIEIVEETLVGYRQHAGNAVGLARGWRQRIARIQRLIGQRGGHVLPRQLDELRTRASPFASAEIVARIDAILQGFRGPFWARLRATWNRDSACAQGGWLLRLLILAGCFRT